MANPHRATPKSHLRIGGISLLTVGLTAVGLLIGQTAGAHITYPYEVENQTQRQYYQAPPRPAVLSAEVEEIKEEPAGPTVDPQELKSVRQQVSDLLREIKRLKGMAKKGKLTDVLEELNAIEAKLQELQARLKTVPLDEARDVLEEFYQERYHEQLNPLQQKVELPNEIKNVIKQITDLRREIKNLKKQALRNKVGGVEEELNALDAKLANLPAKFNAAPFDDLRDILQDEFYEVNYWEQLNPLRAKIELPRELKEIERRLREAEKLLKTKSVQKALEGLGIKIEAVRNKLSEMQAAYEAVKNQLASGDFEDLEETLQPIRETHPGMVTGMLHGVREAWSGIRRVKDQEVRDALLRFLTPAVSAINEGDYEELMFIQKEIGPEFDRLLEKALRANLRGRNRSDLLQRLEKLDTLIEGKLGEREEREAREVPEAKPESIPTPVPVEKPVPEATPTPAPTPEAPPPPPPSPSPSPEPTPSPTPESSSG